MAQRREIEARLTLYDDLSGILGAMRSFALAELRWVGRREEAQHHVMQALTGAMGDMAFAMPEPEHSGADVWLLFGSTRGFCGSFNEDVLRLWRETAAMPAATIVVGERLAEMLPPSTSVLQVSGAEGGLDASSAIDRILLAINQARETAGNRSGLVACWRDEQIAHTERLLPLAGFHAKQGQPPLTNERPDQVATQVVEHYLFHRLLALLLRSIRIENHMRLLQMENALRHLDQGSDELRRQRNRLRQEEIVEEIELMARGRVTR